MKFSKLSKILTVVLLVSVLAISLIACSTSKDNKDEKQSTDSSISTLMATEPSDADEALKLYNQLMKKENCEKTGTKFQINDKEEIEYVSWDEYNREIVEGKLTGVDFPDYKEGDS